jgi:prepilin-type N-terminal cleavage/methylation domain-containing protein
MVRPLQEFLRKMPRAFTLVELLVVVTILALLAAIALPAIGRARVSSGFATASGNMRALAGAVHMYAMDNDGTLPRMRGPGAGNWALDQSWPALVRPYLGVTNTGVSTLTNAMVFQDPNEKIHNKLSDFGCNAYVMVEDDPGAKNALKLSQIAKPSKTILLAMAREQHGSGVRGTWYIKAQNFVSQGTNLAASQAKPSDRGTGKIAFVHVDGSAGMLLWEEFVAKREMLLDPAKAE